MAGEITSNIDAVAAKVQAAIESFGFNARSADGGETVGEACARAVAEDIASSAVDLQQTPKGDEFPDNDPDYAEMKERKYGRAGRSYGIRTGQTLSVESLMGQVEATDDTLTMRYGTGKPPSHAVGGSGLVTPADQKATDIEKAEWLTRSNPRTIDFYQVGPYAEKDVKEIVARSLKAHIEQKLGA